MSKYEEANLILKLYELRREPELRRARDWWFTEFHPESMADVQAAMFGEHSQYLRMVTSYWDMAAAMVRHGAISLDFFNDANGEHYGIFSKLEPFLPALRAAMGPQFMVNLEALIDSTVGGRERGARMRERQKSLRSEREEALLAEVG